MMRCPRLARAGTKRAVVLAAALVVLASGDALAGRGLDVPPPAQLGSHALLDVPYVPQTPELCGGAAVAMVLRYWGERDVFAEDFASLVVPGDRGIPTGALASAVRGRSWQALVLPAGNDMGRTRIRTEVDQGRPLIALIEVAPREYHYVVIVGATDQEVVLHDPARAPFRVLRWPEFDRAWAVTDRWLMLVLPPDGARPRTAVESTDAVPRTAAVGTMTPCAALVDRGVALALAGESGTEEALVAATRLCPADPAAWRELGGWRFSQSRWAEAEDFSERALRLAPDDTHARRLVATSRYLLGDESGALHAWTPLGEPRIDAINIRGAVRTPHPVMVRSTGLLPRQILTAELYGRARRRLSALPVASSARLRYEPLDTGLTTVEAHLVERDLVPRGWIALATLAGRAAVSHELRIDVAGALDAGELTSVAWRWPSARPSVALGLSIPAPPWLPGVVSLTALWERQSYQLPSAPPPAPALRESRRRSALSIAEWATSRLRWNVGIALDRFDTRRTLGTDGGLDVRLAADHVALRASVAGWAPFDGGQRFGTVGLRGAWRSNDEPNRPLLSGIAAFSRASRSAPLALWGAAGVGSARGSLLRAHRLLEDDVLTGDVFGREVAHATMEYSHPIARAFAADVSLAGFVDVARAWRGLPDARLPFLADAGLGLRVQTPGRPDTLRIDLAHGLRGGGARGSITWARAWPW